MPSLRSASVYVSDPEITARASASE